MPAPRGLSKAALQPGPLRTSLARLTCRRTAHVPRTKPQHEQESPRCHSDTVTSEQTPRCSGRKKGGEKSRSDGVCARKPGAERGAPALSLEVQGTREEGGRAFLSPEGKDKAVKTQEKECLVSQLVAKAVTPEPTCWAPFLPNMPHPAPEGAHCIVLMLAFRQYSRLNSSSQTNSLKDLLQSKIDDLERQVLSRVNTLEEGKGGSKNDTEERVKIENALTSLHQRISELEKGQKDSRPGDKFQLTFPLRTNYMYAKVKKSLPEMYAFTVCMWLKSSAAPGVGTPFSYAVPGQANELVLIEWGNNPMEILINDKVAKLPFVINDGKWHHICITWTTRDGVWEAYQDGTQGGNGENLAPYHPIKPQGVLVLGQEQDTLGGGFDATQAFVGELAHFNIWDRKLTPGEVYNLATCSTKALSGNVIAWAESHIEIYGGATKWTFEACRQIN
ncbi:neuronal pentraxin 1-like protein [Camelus ferus]|nr:neuronal pentraxin 1-like protein [Camelus ferus]